MGMGGDVGAPVPPPPTAAPQRTRRIPHRPQMSPTGLRTDRLTPTLGQGCPIAGGGDGDYPHVPAVILVPGGEEEVEG